jgi:diguanylate cyclase (GGDEF)-like protein
VAVSRPRGAREIERLERQGQNIIGIFAGSKPSTEAAGRAAERLRKEYGESIYSILLYCLTFKPFEADEAQRLWQEVLQHKYLMSERLRRDVGMRVATLDYFLHYKRIILDARMIALQDLDEILVVANRDSLTGLYNHRSFYERLEEEVERARGGGRKLSLLMVDIDYFKTYNDTLGHLRGDLVLREVAYMIKNNIRPGDIACRYGGDEFSVLCPGADKAAAREVGERLRSAVEKKKFFHEEQLDHAVTLSVGVATFPEDTDTHRGLVELADGALYVSKKRGRNRVT